MKINLAGYNVDVDVLDSMRINEVHGGQMRIVHDSDALTPEVLSAAYARISRAPDSVDVLRRKAAENVKKARKSNETIIFEMGHASVSEHAVFNFDLMDISRYAIEAVEHSRLCSYTEKSQRYVTFDPAKQEFMVPFEIADSGYEADFRRFIEDTHEQYHWILNRIKDQERPQGGSPEEDARYVTTLAVTGQLGMTLNARNLEMMVRRLASSPLHEAKQIGRGLHELVKDVAPSLVRYTNAEPIRRDALSIISEAALLHLRTCVRDVQPVQLLTAPGRDDGGDHFILATLLHQASQAPFSLCHAAIEQFSPKSKFMLMRELLLKMDVWSAAPRAFEMADFSFELVVSASCFAQLKRHRMATLLPQAYDISLGYTVPESIQQDMGALARFQAVMRTAEAFSRKLARICGEHVAPYALTQAHRRRVLLRMNARELYAFSRLREDGHAQWEIRDIAHIMLDFARNRMPLTMALACGKDQFEEWRTKILSAP